MEVEDHFTVDKLKELYSQEAEEGLLPQDKLIFNQVDMDDSKKTVQQCGLEEGAVIIVDRESTHEVTIKYTCGGKPFPAVPSVLAHL